MPTRLNIAWQDDNTLRIDSDAGEQTRLLNFAANAAVPTEASWQGHSVASWTHAVGGFDMRAIFGDPKDRPDAVRLPASAGHREEASAGLGPRERVPHAHPAELER